MLLMTNKIASILIVCLICVSKLLNIMEYKIPYTANVLLLRCNLNSKETFRKAYMNPAIKSGLIAMTLPDKPNSRNQRYVKNNR